MPSVKLALFSPDKEFYNKIESAECIERIFEDAFGFPEDSIFNFELEKDERSVWLLFETSEYFDEHSFIKSGVSDVIYGKIYYDGVGENYSVISYKGNKVGVKKLNELLLEDNIESAFLLSLYRNKVQLFNKACKALNDMPMEIFGQDLLSYISSDINPKIKSYVLNYYKEHSVDIEQPYDSDLFRELLCDGDFSGLRELSSVGMPFTPPEGEDDPISLMIDCDQSVAEVCDPVELLELLIELGSPIVAKPNSMLTLLQGVVRSHFGIDVEKDDVYEYIPRSEINIKMIEILEQHGCDIMEDIEGCSLRWWANPEFKAYLEKRGVPFYSSKEQYSSPDTCLNKAISHMDYEVFDKLLTKENIEIPSRFSLYDEALKTDDYFFKKLLEVGCKPRDKERVCSTLIKSNRLDLLKSFIEHGMPIYPFDKDIQCAFRESVIKFKTETIRELQGMGFDCAAAIPCALDYLKEEPEKLLEITRIVLEGGSTPNVEYVRQGYMTPLEEARSFGYDNLVDLLVSYGADDQAEKVKIY